MTDWNKYFRMIVKKSWLIILITVVFVLIASYVSFFMIKPRYEASTRLIVLINSKDYNGVTYEDLLAGQLLVKNYKELIKSRAVTSEVIRKVQLTDMTDDDLAKSINVELEPDSSMIRILVQHENPAVVANIVNEVSTVFIQKASELLKINNIILVDKAIIPEKPVYSRAILIIGFSFLAGIFLSLGLVLTIAFFDDTLGNYEEVELKTGLPVIGIIPDMRIR